MKDMTSICSGKMTLKEINQEIIKQMLRYEKIRKLVVKIKRQKNGYHATIYIDKKQKTEIAY